MVEMGHAVWVKRLQERGQESAIPLLKPAKHFVKIVLILMAALVWLDNLGFDVGALLASLGGGGVAFALVAQNTLKYLIGSVMVLLDKPYQGGNASTDRLCVNLKRQETNLRFQAKPYSRNPPSHPAVSL